MQKYAIICLYIHKYACCMTKYFRTSCENDVELHFSSEYIIVSSINYIYIELYYKYFS